MSAFPSDHGVLIGLMVVIMAAINLRLGAVFAAYFVLYSACRVGEGLHRPTDMVGGGIIGAVFGRLMLWIEGRFAQRLAELALQIELHAAWTYTGGFLFLREFSSGLVHIRAIVHGLFHFRLFH